jgi:hypothetical protein
MPAPSGFIIGIKTFTYNSQTYTGIVRVDFRDGTTLSGEGYDDDTSDTEVWSGPHRGNGTVHLRDPATAQALKGTGADTTSVTLIVVGHNRNGATNSTHTFTSVVFAQPGGDVPGGAMAPESISVNFRYGDLTITQAG